MLSTEEGRGSTFTVQLPLVHPAARADPGRRRRYSNQAPSGARRGRRASHPALHARHTRGVGARPGGGAERARGARAGRPRAVRPGHLGPPHARARRPRDLRGAGAPPPRARRPAGLQHRRHGARATRWPSSRAWTAPTSTSRSVSPSLQRPCWPPGARRGGVNAASRVVHVASGREWRGGQRQVWLLARELARLGDIEQVVVTGGRQRAGHADSRATDPRCTRSPGAPGWTRECCPAILRRASSPARALVHAHDAHAAWHSPALAARLAGATLVVTRRVGLPAPPARALARAERVIAISQAVARRAGWPTAFPASGSQWSTPASSSTSRPGTPRLGIRQRLGLPASSVGRRQRRRPDRGKGPRDPASRGRRLGRPLPDAALGHRRGGTGAARLERESAGRRGWQAASTCWVTCPIRPG